VIHLTPEGTMHFTRSGAVISGAAQAGVALALVAGLAIMTACVSTDAYELARKDAENARLLHQNEQRHAQELALANKRMKQQIEEMQATLREMRETLARTERDWRETRDELLRIKIDREQQRRGGREREAQVGLETLKQPTEASRSAPPDLEGARRKASPPDEVKQRLKTVLEQLQGVLQEF
jgi:TolA-binding protein